MNRLNNNFDELIDLLEHADELDVGAADSPEVQRRHADMVDELEQFYMDVEIVLGSVETVETPGGDEPVEFPDSVPEHVRDRVSGRRDTLREQPDTTEPADPEPGSGQPD